MQCILTTKNTEILKKKNSEFFKQRRRGKKKGRFLALHYILFSSVSSHIYTPILCLCAGFITNRKLATYLASLLVREGQKPGIMC